MSAGMTVTYLTQGFNDLSVQFCAQTRASAKRFESDGVGLTSPGNTQILRAFELRLSCLERNPTQQTRSRVPGYGSCHELRRDTPKSHQQRPSFDHQTSINSRPLRFTRILGHLRPTTTKLGEVRQVKGEGNRGATRLGEVRLTRDGGSRGTAKLDEVRVFTRILGHLRPTTTKLGEVRQVKGEGNRGATRLGKVRLTRDGGSRGTAELDEVRGLGV
ncbi:hypothetical protein M231_04486 [Tremella mesenterica]|uniref:Uncharacterized protein n=1 Tax=Tremella mesenterica TaxID=5217 RepID=A0A4Q1BKS1_TREME|nr:hypothetical protein M231_04486 [Tremella mesenterica]